MNNDDNNLNSNLSNEDENLNINKITESKNNFNDKDLLLNDFEADLNISDIVNNDANEIKSRKNSKNNNPFENTSIDKSLSDDFENINKMNIINENIENSNESSIQNIQIDLNNNNNDDENKKIKKRTKDDLNNTPLPIFECLYCTNEKIVFGHFINETLSKKYLLQTSIYDMNDLDKLILNKRLINKDDKNEKLLNLVIKNTEYIKYYIPREKSTIYFNSIIFSNLCKKNEIDNHRLFKQKIEDSIVRKKKDFYFKGINKIPRNSMNNKCLFNSTNSLINNFNALSGLVEPVPQINANNNNVKNNYTIATCSNNNSINFNSLSLNNNDFNCYCKDNNNMLDYIVEKIEKNDESVNYADDKEEILDFFKFDLSRKITKKDIKWENKFYDIWKPDISSDFDENDNNDNEYTINIKNSNNIEDNKNKSINISNLNNKNIINNKSININKSMGFIKYNISKKNNNLIFTFNKNKEKNKDKNKYNDINKNTLNNINKNSTTNVKIDKTINNKSKNYSIKTNDRNQSKEKDIKNSLNITNKSSHININQSHDLKKYSNKYINNYNFNQFYYKNKKFLSNLSYMKSFGSTTNSSYNINKSANFLGKSRQKNYIHKKESNININTKSLQYISNSNNNNYNSSSINYSIGVSINLKSNSSVKSNGIINCWNPDKVSVFQVNENKSINHKKKEKKNNINDKNKKNKLFNIFNNINIFNLNLNHERAKSNYNLNYKKEKKVPKTSNSENKLSKYKNQNKKNNFSIYKKNNNNQQNIFFSTAKQKQNKVISRTNELLYSSNSIFNNINNNDGLYVKSLGLSFGSNENNISENNVNVVFNSISNINKSNSNINNSNNNYSPNKSNKTFYYNRHNNDLKHKINNLISMINNKRNNNIKELYYINKNKNLSNLKNRYVHCFNSTSYIDNLKYKKNKNADSNKSFNF